jgi:hypothetical protein
MARVGKVDKRRYTENATEQEKVTEDFEQSGRAPLKGKNLSATAP